MKTTRHNPQSTIRNLQLSAPEKEARCSPLALVLLVATLSRPAAAMAADTIVTVGTRSSVDDMFIDDVVGTGPTYTLELDEDPPAWLAVGDTLMDATVPSKGPYLVTAININNRVIVRDYLGTQGEPAEGDASSRRAYSAIANAIADIDDFVNSGGDTYEIRVFNDASTITESPFTVASASPLTAGGHLLITVPPGERHDGTAGTGARWVVPSAGVALKLDIGTNTPKQTVEWLEIDGPADTTTFTAGIEVKKSGTSTVLRNLIIHDTTMAASSTHTNLGIRIAAPNVDVINSLIYAIGRDGTNGFANGIGIASGGTNARILNCTIDRCDTSGINGANASGAKPLVQNCAAFGAADVDKAFLIDAGDWGTGSGNNCSDATTEADMPGGTGAGNIATESATDQFVLLTPGSENYHLKAGADCIDGGTDLSTDFTDDYHGQWRNTPWSIGADAFGLRAFFVDATAGDDNNVGRFSDAPWQTVAKVNAATLAAGDFIHFKRTQEFAGQVVVQDSGTSASPITYTAYGTGDDGDDLPIIGFDQKLTGTWTDEGDNVYSITLASGSLNQVAVEDDGGGFFRHVTWMGTVTDCTQSEPDPPAVIQAVEDKAGSFWWDKVTDTVYLHSYDTTNPNPNTNGRAVLVTDSSSKCSGAKTLVFDTDGQDYVHLDRLHLVGGYRLCRIGKSGQAIPDPVPSNFCELRHCWLSGAATWALRINHDSSDLEIFDNQIKWCGLGIRISSLLGGGFKNGTNNSRTINIYSNTITDIKNPHADYTDIPGSPNQPEGDGISGNGCHDVDVYDNTVERAKGGGAVHFYADAAVSEPLTNITIRQNTLRTSHRGIFFSGGGKFKGALAYYNLIESSRGPNDKRSLGIATGDFVQFDSVFPLKIYNNTIYDSSQSLYLHVDTIVLKNNLSLDPKGNNSPNFTGWHINDIAGETSAHVRDYNCYSPLDTTHQIQWDNVSKSDLGSYQTASGQEDASIDSDPDVENKGNGDFHLKLGSPCIDAGVDVGLEEDRDGNPLSGAPDIGAFEYQGQ